MSYSIGCIPAHVAIRLSLPMDFSPKRRLAE